MHTPRGAAMGRPACRASSSGAKQLSGRAMAAPQQQQRQTSASKAAAARRREEDAATAEAALRAAAALAAVVLTTNTLALPPPPPASAAAAAAAASAATASPSSSSSSSSPSAAARLLLDDARLDAVTRRLPPVAPPPSASSADLPVPDIRRITLPNGLRVLLLEDKEVPLVRGSLFMAGGQAASPADKVGLASITAAVQRSGGSRQHPADALDARLEDLAAAVEASAGPRAVSIDFECSAEDAAEVLSLVSELAADPLFPDDKLSVTKSQVLEALSHRNDSAAGVARREAQKLALGASSPFARTPTAAGVGSISRGDLQAYWRAWERPDSAVLGVVGDFDAAEMERTIRDAGFASWAPAAGEPAAPRPQPFADDNGARAGGGDDTALSSSSSSSSSSAANTVWLVDRPGAPQASVAAAEPGVGLLHPDAFPLAALNSVLNGFGGELFDALRTRDALCYSVSAGFELPVDHSGAFVAQGETTRPAAFLVGLRRVLGDAAASPPSPAKLAKAKEERLNSFVFSFATPSAQLSRAAAYELLGVPPDLLFAYRRGIEAVTAADVQAAAARRLHPADGGRTATVVVGDAATVRPELEAAGFRVVDLDVSSSSSSS